MAKVRLRAAGGNFADAGDTTNQAIRANIVAGATQITDGTDTVLVSAAGRLLVDATGGFAAGTEYTEDVASVADPSGTASILIRQDTPAALVSADGDNVARRGTNYGAAYTQIVTSAGAFVDTFGGGTQYADGAVRGTATGTLMMVDDGTNIQSAKGDTSGRLDVTVASGTIGTVSALGVGTTGPQKAEDSAHVNTDAGIFCLGVRQAADAPLSGTDGDYEALQTDANGHLKVNVKEAVITSGTITTVTTLTGTTTLTPGTGAANLGKAEDAAHTTGDVGVMMLGVRNDNGEIFVGTNLDYSPISVDSSGAVFVTNSGGLSVTPSFSPGEPDGGATAYNIMGTDGTNYRAIRTNIEGNLLVGIGDGTNLAAVLTDGADNVSNATNELVTASLGYVFDGTNWDRALGNSTDGALVNLGSNNDVTITSGTVTTVSALGTGTTGPQKAEDSVHANTDAGIFCLGVRQAADAPLSGSDGDYEALQTDANGHLKVNVKSAVITSGVITSITDPVAVTLAAGAAAIAKAEDVASANADVGVPAMAVQRATPADTAGTDGDYEFLQIKSGRLWGSNIVTDVIPGTAATNLGKAEDAGHTSGDVGVMSLAVRQSADAPLSGSDLDYEPLQTDANGYLKVNVKQAVITSGTITTVSALGVGTTGPQKAEDVAHATGDMGIAIWGVENAANTSFSGGAADYTPIGVDAEGSVRNIGNRAHDAIDAGNPIKIGARAVALLADPTAVASNDRTDLYAMRNGIQFTIGGHPNVIHRQFNITDADGAQTDLNILNAVVAATDVCVVTMLSVMCANSNTVDVQCRIGFGATTTPGNDALKVILSHAGIAKGSGIVLGNGGGIVGMGAAGDELRMTCEDPVSGSIDVCVTYFIISNA